MRIVTPDEVFGAARDEIGKRMVVTLKKRWKHAFVPKIPKGQTFLAIEHWLSDHCTEYDTYQATAVGIASDEEAFAFKMRWM